MLRGLILGVLTSLPSSIQLVQGVPVKAVQCLWIEEVPRKMWHEHLRSLNSDISEKDLEKIIMSKDRNPAINMDKMRAWGMIFPEESKHCLRLAFSRTANPKAIEDKFNIPHQPHTHGPCFINKRGLIQFISGKSALWVRSDLFQKLGFSRRCDIENDAQRIFSFMKTSFPGNHICMRGPQ